MVFEYVYPRDRAKRTYEFAASAPRKPAFGAKEWSGTTQADVDADRWARLLRAEQYIQAAYDSPRVLFSQPSDDNLDAMLGWVRQELDRLHNLGPEQAVR